jgi:hypothetical protein
MKIPIAPNGENCCGNRGQRLPRITAPARAEHRPNPETSGAAALGLSQSERDEMTSLTHARAHHDAKPGSNLGSNVGNSDSHAPLSNPEVSVDGLHRIKTMAESNPVFAKALRNTTTTEAAAQLAQAHGIVVSPEALWRQRGTLTEAGLPTWRG